MSVTPQRGSGWSIRLALAVNKIFGYRFFYILLYPITFFYFIKAKNVRAAIRVYYENIGIKFKQKTYFRHLRYFAITMTDRFMIKKMPNRYNIIADDYEEKIQIIKDGAILILSHYGGWSVAGDFIKSKDAVINIVMRETIKEEIKKIENNLEKKSTLKIIDLSSEYKIDSYLKIAHALSKKESIAFMIDRPFNKKHQIKMSFFNKLAYFNKAPFEIAKKANMPIYSVFLTYKKNFTYELELERIENNEDALKTYIKILEKKLRKNPEQWFNLYNFWSED